MQTSPDAGRWFLAGVLAALLPVGAKAILAAAPSNPVSLQALIEADWVQQDELFTPSPARGAAGAPAGVTTADDAAGGCDGVKNGRWGFHTASGETDP